MVVRPTNGSVARFGAADRKLIDTSERFDAKREVLPVARTDHARSAIADPYGGRADGGFSRKSVWQTNSGYTFVQQLALALGGEKEMNAPYLQSVWVYACVRAIVRKVASMPLQVWSRPGERGELIEDRANPLVKLLARPNPILKTKRRFAQTLVTYDQLFGETFLFAAQFVDGKAVPVVVEGGLMQMPDEFLVVRGDLVDCIKNAETGMPTGWRIHTGGKTIVWPEEATVHLFQLDPYNPLRGIGPMAAAMRAATKDYQADRFDEAILANGGMPGAVLEVAGDLSDPQRATLKKSWEQNVGRPQQHRRPVVLERGITYKAVQQTPQEMELADLRRWDRDSIMTVFGCTKTTLGLDEDVNRSTAEVQDERFLTDTVLPIVEALEDDLNSGFVERLRGKESSYEIRFDRTPIEALRGNIAEKASTIHVLMGDGRSFDEAAAIVNMKVPVPVEGGGDRYVDQGMVPVDLVREVHQARGQAPPARAKGEADRVTPNEARALLSACTGEKSDDEVRTELRGGDELESLTDAERAFVERFDHDERAKYAHAYEAKALKAESRIHRAAKRPLKDFILHTRKRILERAKRLDDEALTAKGVDEWLDVETKRGEAEIERQLEAWIRAGIAEWNDALEERFERPFEITWDEAAKDMAAELDFGDVFSADDPRARKLLRDKAIEVAEGSMSTLADDIKKTIMRGFREGGSDIGSLTRRLKETLDAQKANLSHMANNTPARAERIARTEANSIQNGARVGQMDEAGIKRHVWVSARDGDVRATHRHDGTVREIGKAFPNGLRYPGDSERAKDAGDVANCRCTTAPVVTTTTESN